MTSPKPSIRSVIDRPAGAQTLAGRTALRRSAAGPVALMAPEVAKRLGLRVIGLLGSRAEPTYASGFGAGHLIDLSVEREWAAAVAALTGGRGVVLLVDGDAGSASTRPFEVIAPGGEGVFIAATSGAPAAPMPPGLLIVSTPPCEGSIWTSPWTSLRGLGRRANGSTTRSFPYCGPERSSCP